MHRYDRLPDEITARRIAETVDKERADSLPRDATEDLHLRGLLERGQRLRKKPAWMRNALDPNTIQSFQRPFVVSAPGIGFHLLCRPQPPCSGWHACPSCAASGPDLPACLSCAASGPDLPAFPAGPLQSGRRREEEEEELNMPRKRGAGSMPQPMPYDAKRARTDLSGTPEVLEFRYTRFGAEMHIVVRAGGRVYSGMLTKGSTLSHLGRESAREEPPAGTTAAQRAAARPPRPAAQQETEGGEEERPRPSHTEVRACRVGGARLPTALPPTPFASCVSCAAVRPLHQGREPVRSGRRGARPQALRLWQAPSLQDEQQHGVRARAVRPLVARGSGQARRGVPQRGRCRQAGPDAVLPSMLRPRGHPGLHGEDLPSLLPPQGKHLLLLIFHC